MEMETSTWITMILILGLVWGGFGFLLVKALRKESSKRGAERQRPARS
jgi:hypothetical protein